MAVTRLEAGREARYSWRMIQPDLSLNPAARIDFRRMGRDNQPLLIIDDVLLKPEEMIAFAAESEFSPPPHTKYPGVNALMPEGYGQVILGALRPLLQRGFGVPTDIPLHYFGFLALATRAPDQLEPVQKVPHIDAADPFRIAMVHFLCKGKQGGTGFFRHLATGLEMVGPRQIADFETTLRQELDDNSLPRHTGGHTPGFEMIDFADAVFNRLIVYRSNSLHAGLLEDSALTDDPRTGRLTANSFVYPTKS